jgi:NADH-quinone oxidoreductase subunit M
LFKMMRGLFYGPMDQKYSHSHDAVAVVDRLPLLIMIVVSIGFGLFPMHMYNVVRSGVDPLVAKITLVVPVAEASEEQAVPRERTSRVTISPSPLVATKPGEAPPPTVTGLP